MSEQVGPRDDSGEREYFDVGILFVHGIGNQTRGSTLTEFGNPLVQWLASRAGDTGGSARVTHVHLAADDHHEPARAELTIEIGGRTRRWLLTEAWWAESFQSPRFSQFAVWCLSIAPRTFGTHFGRKLRRVFASRKTTTPVRWIGELFQSSLSLIAALVVSIVMQVVMSLLLVVGVIPWRVLRDSLVRLQLTLAAYLGDSYVLVERPIEAAAILTKFRDDFAWIRSRSRRTAVIAHSQGAAVACRGLAGGHEPADLLVTFGSGLRKLEEQEELHSRTDLRDGGAWTLLGFVWTVAGAISLIARLRAPDSEPVLVLFLLPYLVIGALLLGAGLRDFVSASDPQSIRDLCAFFKNEGLRWLDVYASADPVPNGPLDQDRSYPQSEEIVNFRSFVTDHVAYWQNRDDFVSLIGNATVSLDPPLSKLAFSDDVLRFLRARREHRLELLQAAKWMTAILAAATVAVYRVEWSDVVRWSVSHLLSLTGYETSPQALAFAVWRQSAGSVAVLLTLYGIVYWVWRVWNHRVMASLPPNEYHGVLPMLIGSAMTIQLIAGALMVTHGNPPSWLMFATITIFVAISTTWSVTEPEKPAGFPASGAAQGATTSESSAVRTVQAVIEFLMMVGAVAAPPIGVFVMVWWIHGQVDKWLPVSWFNWVIALLTLVLFFLAMGSIGEGIKRFFRKRKTARLSTSVETAR